MNTVGRCFTMWRRMRGCASRTPSTSVTARRGKTNLSPTCCRKTTCCDASPNMRTGRCFFCFDCFMSQVLHSNNTCTRTHACMHTQTHAHTHACKCTHTHAHECTHIHTHIHVSTCAHTHTHTHTYTHTHKPHIHAHTHTHTHTHMHTCTYHTHAHMRTPCFLSHIFQGAAVHIQRSIFIQ